MSKAVVSGGGVAEGDGRVAAGGGVEASRRTLRDEVATVLAVIASPSVGRRGRSLSAAHVAEGDLAVAAGGNTSLVEARHC